MKTRPAPLIPENQVATAPKAPPRPVSNKPAEPLQWFKVLDGPRNHTSAPGAVGPFRRENGDFTLKVGKVFNSGQYDVQMLRNAGVKLEEVEAPGWYVQAQKDAHERVEQLRADGIAVGDAPEYQPTPLGGSAA